MEGECMIFDTVRQVADKSNLLGTLLLFAATSFVRADDAVPDRLDFGVVHVGASVQGTVKVFAGPDEARLPRAVVAPPDFVRVEAVVVGERGRGAGNVRGYCNVAVTIDRSRAGEFSAPLVVRLGERHVEVRITANVRPRDRDRPRVLAADTPFHVPSTVDARLFDPWRRLVERCDLDVDYLRVRPGKAVFEGVDPAKFDAVLVGQMGVVGLEPGDVAALRKYAEGGGRVILTANSFARGAVDKAHQVLIPYGLKRKDGDAQAIVPIEVGPPQITPGPLTAGVNALSFARPSPTVALDKDRAKVVVASPTDPDDHFVAMAQAGEGSIVTIGVPLWWAWIGQSDNAILLENAFPKRHRAE
jgi:hypothetical protein